MKKHTPAALTLVLGLVGATGLFAAAPSHDVDAVTDTPAVQATQEQRSEAVPVRVAQAPAR